MANMDMSALDAENLGLLDEDNMKLEDHDMNDTGERQEWLLTWQSVLLHKARCHCNLHTHIVGIVILLTQPCCFSLRFTGAARGTRVER